MSPQRRAAGGVVDLHAAAAHPGRREDPAAALRRRCARPACPLRPRCVRLHVCMSQIHAWCCTRDTGEPTVWQMRGLPSSAATCCCCCCPQMPLTVRAGSLIAAAGIFLHRHTRSQGVRRDGCEAWLHQKRGLHLGPVEGVGECANVARRSLQASVVTSSQ